MLWLAQVHAGKLGYWFFHAGKGPFRRFANRTLTWTANRCSGVNTNVTVMAIGTSRLAVAKLALYQVTSGP